MPAAEEPRAALPPEWQPGLDALRALPDGAAALLIGATDRGKTTFAALAAQALAAEFERIAVVDADIGQSEIGPPGTVGVAWADVRTPRLHDLKPAARFFVGSFTPISAALEHAVATAQATRWARAGRARRILVDTTGFVVGPAARRLKVAKATLAAPALILGIARDGELDALLTVLAAATGAQVLALPVPNAVQRKSQTFRATRRMSRLSQALENAREMALPLAGIVTVGVTLGTGLPLPPHLVRWTASALRLPVAYAEQGESALSVYLTGGAPRTGGGARSGWEANAAPVAEHFGVRTVRVLSLAAHEGLLVGLHDERGLLLSVGRFLDLDPERREITVSAPPPALPERIRLVAFGRVRAAPDGSAGSEVRPGEI